MALIGLVLYISEDILDEGPFDWYKGGPYRIYWYPERDYERYFISLYSIEINEKYGKSNPIYTESSFKKGESILKLSHSTLKPIGESDLSTNSRSSLNNTFTKKQLFSKSKVSLNHKLKKYSIKISSQSSRGKGIRMDKFEKFNKEATRLIERSIIKNRLEMTPHREFSKIQKLDLSGAQIAKSKIKQRKNSLVKRANYHILPFPTLNNKLKKKIKILSTNKKQEKTPKFSLK